MTRIFAHRGGAGEQPENSLGAFQQAASLGVDGFETDIALTADFVPVLHHDPHLPDGRLIKNSFRSEISNIPSLPEALIRFPKFEWLLEIKTFPQSNKTHAPAVMVERVLNAIDVAGIAPENIHIMAFDWAVLREVASQNEHLSRVCLSSPETEAAHGLWWGQQTKISTTPEAVAQTGADAWAAYYESLTVPLLREAHALGLKVFAWTVNKPEDFARLAPLVDGIITDYPSRFIPPRR